MPVAPSVKIVDRQQHAARMVAVEQFHQRRIAGAVRIGVAQEDLVALNTTSS